MSALTIKLKTTPAQRVDMSPLVCHKLQGMALTDIAALELQCGRRKRRVDELFEIDGIDTNRIIIQNSAANLDFIGQGLQGGTMIIEGDAGAYLGQSMRAGTIRLSGSAGIFAGCEMADGLLEIGGNCGDFLGGALPGNKQGMRGGTILVKGDAGGRVGDHMRRGVILIEGNVADYCGSRMIAGTIAVMGRCGRFLGYAMRRGTILLWQCPELIATFKDCGTHTLAFLPMLFNSFQAYDSRFADAGVAFNRVQRFGGDLAETGKGEILVKLD